MIPNHFHAVWVGPPLPDAFRKFMEGWRRLHPAWGFTLWAQECELPPMRNQDLYDRAEELCPGFEGQLRSDIARLEILHTHGGVYVDTDFEAIRPIDRLLEGLDCFAAWERQDTVANNAILGCSRGHAFIKHLIDALPASVLGNPGRRPSKVSGPHFLTAELRKWKGEPVEVFPQKWFYPVRCDELAKLHDSECYPEAYALHWWGNQHRLKGRPL